LNREFDLMGYCCCKQQCGKQECCLICHDVLDIIGDKGNS